MSNVYLGAEGVMTAEKAAQMPVVVYGACPYPDYVTAFANVEEFHKWSETLPMKDRIAQALQKTEQAKLAYEQNPLAAMVAQQSTIKAIRSQMDALAGKTGMDPNSHELFLKATLDADPIEGPIFRSAQLFEHPNCTGRRLDIRSWQWYPNLAWLGFDDSISSVRVHAWSILVLCEHPNFQGRWTWFFGGLWGSNEFNLDHVINDTVSSAFCIGV